MRPRQPGSTNPARGGTDGSRRPTSRHRSRSTRARGRRFFVLLGVLTAIASAATAATLTFLELSDEDPPVGTGAGAGDESLASETDPVATFCDQFRTFDEQFNADPNAADQEVIDAVRSLEAPPAIASDHTVLVQLVDDLAAGNLVDDADLAAYELASGNVQAFVDENC